ncbi:MAG: Uncharacterised protein [Formosa sp. Hel1_33_131]|jgi:hypothetical protein|nr:MAG: Uncharacterised protein [Formosa sp. Hel1_33_131]|tara:strand:- start:4141 stop:4911 length:771 start_codon:yes stop_codon:yes gene_type:complete
MNRIYHLLTVSLTILCGCSSDTNNSESPVHITLNFSHHWDDTRVTNSDFNDLKFTNAHGELLSIERLSYLISNIVFTETSGQTILLEGYNLVDVTNQTNLSYTPKTKILTGTYRNVSFVFGFTNEKNTEGTYSDLNAASWNVPMMLGGGYHYMQLDGKFKNNNNETQGYNYHAIRANDNAGDNPTFPKDTYIQVDLGEVTINADVEFDISMNIAEWFKNPNNWDLNDYNQLLMPNSNAQILIYENGQNVFTLEGIN